MDNNSKPVEKKLEGAGTQAGVETTQSKAPEAEVDFLSEYEKVLIENKRLQEERDNYKRIGLARKRGEVVKEELDEDEIERRAEQRAQELLHQKQLEENKRRADEIALKALKENRELKLALKNRQGIVSSPSSGAAASYDNNASTESFFTQDQIAVLKKRGIDPEKVKENYRKLKG